MRIGIDARFFGPVGKGLGRYTQKLVEHLETVAEEHDFIIFLRKENYDLFQPCSKRFRKVLADFRWYTIEEQLRFPALIKRERVDLMHFPHFNIPIWTPCPFVVTIHDLILLRYPTHRATTLNRFMYRFKYTAYRHIIRTAVRKSRKIITVSNYTRDDIIHAFNVPKEKIIVTYEATDLPAPKSAERIQDDILMHHGITKPYFLYVGNAYPHKNLERLLRVFADVRKSGIDTQLVLVGKADYFYERLREEVADLDIPKGDVVFYGYAKETDLPILYSEARAYVFPSLFEGFGLPPLEAMRYGTPVISSKATCLPEILGNAVRYFDPEDERSIAEAMKEIFHNTELRARLTERGREQVAKYQWKECAKKTYEIYQNAISG